MRGAVPLTSVWGGEVWVYGDGRMFGGDMRLGKGAYGRVSGSVLGRIRLLYIVSI